MTLLFPWALILLPFPYLLRLWRSNNNDSAALNVPEALAGFWRQQKAPLLSKNNYIFILWVLLVVALARPAKIEGSPLYPIAARDIVVALDLSASMEREDFSLDGVTASRIEVVRNVAADFIRRLKHERVGLVFFADEAYIAAPLGFDAHSNAVIIEEAKIGLAGRSTAIGDAIGQSIKVFDDEGAASARFIILLSDGTNNAGAVSPTTAAVFAARKGIIIHTIGLASDAFTNSLGVERAANYDLDESTLKEIARASGGRYFRARTSEELLALYKEIEQIAKGEVNAPPLVEYRELNWVSMLLVLFILLLSGGIKWRNL